MQLLKEWKKNMTKKPINKYYEKYLKTDKKYEIELDDCIERDGKKLYRIRALAHFGEPADPNDPYPNLHKQMVHPGDLGGYIESEANLDQQGNSWVYDTSIVMGNARVQNNAVVGRNSEILDNAIIAGHAIVDGGCIVRGNAFVCGDSVVLDRSTIDDFCILDQSAAISHTQLKEKVYLGNRTWIAHSVLVGNIAITNTGPDTERGKQQTHIFLSGLSGNIKFANTYADISQAVLQNVDIRNISELTEIKKAKITDCIIKDIDDLQIELSKLENCSITNCTTVNLYEQELTDENIDNSPCFELIPE